mmetsp:Transcript_31054/g.58225  ORF Transcript_31054/g.58225 Transcript_31054/m.58225 type:complete len:203 (+) Transcript_31054:67-675(+)
MTFSTDCPAPLQIRIADLIAVTAQEDLCEAHGQSDAMREGGEGSQGSVDEDVQVLPSRGSLQHGTGLCKPCAWFWKSQGCHNGAECLHCHLCPPSELRRRRKAQAGAIRPPPGLECSYPNTPNLSSHSQSDTDSESHKVAEHSLGALLHSSGQCKPCMWFWKSQGCARGYGCLHCHLCPPGEVRRRRKLRRAPGVCVSMDGL